MPTSCATSARRTASSRETVGAVALGGEPVSSSRIRDALAAGDPGTATRLLTRPFAVQGVVIHGDKRGRELGWPTANVELGPYQRPAYGIYAVRVRLEDGSEHDGVANLGVRPMFDPPTGIARGGVVRLGRRSLRPHDRGRASPLYTARDEDSTGWSALKAQMDRDAAEARRLLHPSP